MKKMISNKLWILIPASLFLALAGRSQSYSEDTSRISKSYDELLELQYEDIDSALAISRNLLEESVGINYEEGVSTGYMWIAHLQGSLGNNEIALDFYNKALAIYESNKQEKEKAHALNSIGFCYQNMGKSEKAIANFNKAIELHLKLKNTSQISYCYNNIAAVYDEQGLAKEAYEYYMKSLQMSEKFNDTSLIATAYNNLGVWHYYQDNLDSAKILLKKALIWFNYDDDPVGLTSIYTSLGYFYDSEGKKDSALIMYEKSIKTIEGAGFPQQLSSAYSNISILYYEQGDYDLAKKYGLIALKYAQEANQPRAIDYAANQLYSINVALKNYKEALDYYILSKKMNDSIVNASTRYSALQDKFSFEFKQKKFLDSLRHLDEKKILASQVREANLISEKKNIAITITSIASLLLLILGFIIYRRYKISQKQKNIIALQKDIMFEKNMEILDSIRYAKRIQAAILPTKKIVRQNLEKSFIYYKPKDIVAGDFYWMEPKEDRVLFAAADCTGHGVPGAMVSVVCNNGLNRSVREHGLTDPGEILDKTREIVIEEFEKSEEDVKDGMDIALCSLEDGNILKYAGANNPLWLIKNNTNEIQEVKANKQHIGKSQKSEKFKTHELQLSEGDTFYIFSDGFADQFGGDKGKKFKTANLKRLLLSIQNESMEQQKELINKAFEDWMGELEQLDDVCVIGVRV